jgi:hypothetical protein
MYASPELVAAVQRERERSIDRDRLARMARLAARVRACCDPSLISRFVRALGRSPAFC